MSSTSDPASAVELPGGVTANEVVTFDPEVFLDPHGPRLLDEGGEFLEGPVAPASLADEDDG